MGVDVAPVMRAVQMQVSLVTVLVLDEVADGEVCALSGTTGSHIYVLFCAPPSAKTYSIAPPGAVSCPGSVASARIEQDGSQITEDASSGSVTIMHADGECVAGTFAMEVRGEMLSGSFDAVVCD